MGTTDDMERLTLFFGGVRHANIPNENENKNTHEKTRTNTSPFDCYHADPFGEFPLNVPLSHPILSGRSKNASLPTPPIQIKKSAPPEIQTSACEQSPSTLPSPNLPAGTHFALGRLTQQYPY